MEFLWKMSELFEQKSQHQKIRWTQTPPLKIILMLISLFASVSKYLCVDMVSCDSQKYFILIQDYQSEAKITILEQTHAVFSHCLRSIPLSPFRNISLSLSACSAYDSPVMIPHKKRMMFLYHYHCLIDNKHLRTHELFHLPFKYNILPKICKSLPRLTIKIIYCLPIY